MESETRLLNAIHQVDKKVTALETKIDNSVKGQFKDHNRRITNLENNQRWFALAIILWVITELLYLIR